MLSHPMWVRGLKLFMIDFRSKLRMVAPHVGAWIETQILSLPSILQKVAPHVGAWIETNLIWDEQGEPQVAPHVGAWIETVRVCNVRNCILSHPMWVRGLKQLYK